MKFPAGHEIKPEEVGSDHDEYKYLGFLFNEFLDLDKSIQRVFDRGNQALGAVIAKAKASGGLFRMYVCRQNLLYNIYPALANVFSVFPSPFLSVLSSSLLLPSLR